MYIIQKIRSVFINCFLEVSIPGILFLILVYTLSNWVMLALCGEKFIYNFSDYIYWLIVTASTVGYGDYSPINSYGKLVVAFFTIPFGLGLFGLVITKFAGYLTEHLRRGIKGLRKLKMQNHIIIIGWDSIRTPKLIKLLHHEESYRKDGPRQIVLCSSQDIDNPLKADNIKFVRVSSFVNEDEMSRCCVKQASQIIIDIDRDDLTLSAALFCNSQNKSAHIVANFNDEQTGKIASNHCSNIECSPDLSIELLAKSAADKGSSALHRQLLDVSEGMTQYTTVYPSSIKDTYLENIFILLKKYHDATLIAIKEVESDKVQINPNLDIIVKPGTMIHYIADERISNINWAYLK